MSETAGPVKAPVDAITSWMGAMITEVVMAPATLRSVRVGLGRLPDQIADLSTALDATRADLNSALPHLRDGVGAMHDSVDGLSGRLDRLDGAIGQLSDSLGESLPTMVTLVESMQTQVESLSNALLFTLRAIPGVRRAAGRAGG